MLLEKFLGSNNSIIKIQGTIKLYFYSYDFSMTLYTNFVHTQTYENSEILKNFL